MRSYACYPKSRAVYHPSGFVNPFYPSWSGEVARKNQIANRPLANIIRKENDFFVELAVPGLTKEDITIETKDNLLIITGKKQAEGEQPKMLRKEFNHYGFERTFRLHGEADASKVSAEYQAGILTIRIPDKVKVTTQINIQ